MEVEEIKPYDSEGGKAKQVEEMFDSIAPAYDFMNRAMTLGIDRWWRRVAVRMVGKKHPRRILDVATGTGDFAIDLYQKLRPEKVVGIDLSPYAGQTIMVRLTTYDCAFSAHFGSAYFTLECSRKSMQSMSCGEVGPNSFTAPTGFTSTCHSSTPLSSHVSTTLPLVSTSSTANPVVHTPIQASYTKFVSKMAKNGSHTSSA